MHKKKEGCDLRIPVAFATMNDCICTIVAMDSIMKNADDKTYYQFVLLISPDVTQEAKEALSSIEGQYTNCEVSIFDMGDSFKDAYQKVAWINNVTYYRLKLPELLPNEDRCIYLDSDILVCDDLRKFYEHDIKDCYVGGVKAASYHITKMREKWCKDIGLKDMDQYINAGVSYFNLKKIREDGIDKRFIELSKKKMKSQDQDVLNVACYDYIYSLPFKFNAMTKYKNWPTEEYAHVIPPEEIQEGWDEPVVLHFCDKVKPWHDTGAPFAARWWEAYASVAGWNELCRKDIASMFVWSAENKKEEIEKKAKQLADTLFVQTINELERVRCECENIKKSISYRVGRGLTLVPRKIKEAISK